MTHIENRSDKPSTPNLWASLLRIIATFIIYIFHVLRIYDLPGYSFDIIGISIFCFLSGWFCYPVDKPVGPWLLNKFKRILIPYWLVILIVILANAAVSYKEKTLIELVVIFLGGSLFVDNPLYIISWYITFILCLYVMVSLYNYPKHPVSKILILVLSLLFYLYIIQRPLVYLFAFVIGYYLRFFVAEKQVKKSTTRVLLALNRSLFFIQNRSFSFFLLHGGVILFYAKILLLGPWPCLFASLITTLMLAHFHYLLVKKLTV